MDARMRVISAAIVLAILFAAAAFGDHRTGATVNTPPATHNPR